MRSLIAKYGRNKCVVFITVVSILISVIITAFVMESFGPGVGVINIVIGVLAPLVIAPLMSWYMFGLFVRIHELEEEKTRLLTYDSLTGVMSRRAFLTNIETVFKIMKRDGNIFTLAYLDIDFFKKINDSYGHAAGDEVLKLFATTLQNHFRESDLIGRVGGEEFIVFLPNTDVKIAFDIFDAFRKKVENSYVPYFDKRIFYTVSIGLTDFSFSHGNDAVELDSLIDQADQALYKAKELGRNRVAKFS